MAEALRFGISTSNHLPSEPSTTISLGTSKVLVEPTTCKSGAPTQDGSKSSSTKVNTSATSRKPIDALMFSKVKMMKVRKYRYTIDTTEPTRDGRFSILTRKERLRPRD
jgi:hypothetical protein